MRKNGRNTAVEQKKQIFLTIGIIFKNNIRSIERCLKALQPLRDALSCELILADTGSTDGSRQVAERYADILFDFPWINDFSAARNAIMDRASGAWFFTVDTDEYLDEDVSEFVEQLPKLPANIESCTVIQRNYGTYDMDDDYTDFKGAVRILRMSTGLRYHGAIHERWAKDDGRLLRTFILGKTILHHDGYVGLNGEAGREKRERNIKLLREELEKNPESLMAYLQFIESGMSEPDLAEKLDQAEALIEAHTSRWNIIGPAILRYGVLIAYNDHLPDIEDRIQYAQKWFPASPYTRLDVECFAFLYYYDRAQYGECIRYGNRYLSALDKYREGKFDPNLEMCSTVRMTSPRWGELVKSRLAYSHLKCGQYDEAISVLGSVNFAILDVGQTEQVLNTLLELHRTSRADTAEVMKAFWSGITTPTLTQKDSEDRGKAAWQIATQTFLKATQERERNDKAFCRYSYTLFTPLADQWDIGLAAAMMETDNADILSQQLSKIDNWKEFPLAAMIHAFQRGGIFLSPKKKLSLEELDVLIGCLSQDQEAIISLAIQTLQKELGSNQPVLVWARGLTLAAVQVFPWAGKTPDVENGLNLARAFARTEKAFLPLCYASDVLTQENLYLLPPLHRFGWYCAQAYDSLNEKDAVAYVRLLRAGLETNMDMKPMVEFLLNNTPELQAPPPSDELKALAEQIRTVMANFAPDDPAVEALKSSEVYQTVAYLIEGAAAPVWGGLVQ